MVVLEWNNMCQFRKIINVHIPVKYAETMRLYGYNPVFPLSVPCGKCVECRAQRSQQWSFRLSEEAKCWQHAAFITLTYNDVNLPIAVKTGKDDQSDIVIRIGRHHKGLSTLYYPDVQKFNKRLRHVLGKFKFFAVGEYGPNRTTRPHYHLIIFYNGISPEKLYTVIRDVWNKGRVTCSVATEGRLHYIAKYCCDMSISSCKRFQPPFMHCSNRYGLGYNWLSSAMALRCSKRGEKSIQRSYINSKGQRINYLMPLPRFYTQRLGLVSSFEDLVDISVQECYKHIHSPLPSTVDLIPGFYSPVTVQYQCKCRRCYDDLVRSHLYRDEEQHIKFDFTTWLISFHQFALPDHDVPRSRSPIQTYSLQHLEDLLRLASSIQSPAILSNLTLPH